MLCLISKQIIYFSTRYNTVFDYQNSTKSSPNQIVYGILEVLNLKFQHPSLVFTSQFQPPPPNPKELPTALLYTSKCWWMDATHTYNLLKFLQSHLPAEAIWVGCINAMKHESCQCLNRRTCGRQRMRVMFVQRKIVEIHSYMP